MCGNVRQVKTKHRREHKPIALDRRHTKLLLRPKPPENSSHLGERGARDGVAMGAAPGPINGSLRLTVRAG